MGGGPQLEGKKSRHSQIEVGGSTIEEGNSHKRKKHRVQIGGKGNELTLLKKGAWKKTTFCSAERCPYLVGKKSRVLMKRRERGKTSFSTLWRKKTRSRL